MNREKRHPSWWQLWLLFPVLGILAYLDTTLSMPPLAHGVLEVGFVLIIFAGVAVWLHRNEMALVREVNAYAVWREAETPVCSPLEPGAIAGHNGNGHRRAWLVSGESPEAAIAHSAPEEESR